EIESGAGGVGATVKKALSKVWDVFSSIGENFTTITGWITNPIKNFIALAKSAIGEGTSDLEVAIGDLGDKIQDKFSKIDLVELLNAAGFFAIGAGLLRLSGTLKKNRSEEHTSELQSRFDLVCRLLIEKKNSERM